MSLDLEVDGELPLGGAHDIADALEARCSEELGTDVEVETHIEPLQADAAGREAPPERVRAVQRDAGRIVGRGRYGPRRA